MMPLMWRLRSRSLILLFVAMTGLGLAMLASRHHSWIGNWPATGIAVQIVGVFLAIVVAAASAWAGSAEVRNATAEQLAATAAPAWQRSALELGALGVVSAASYLVVSVVAAVRTFGKAGPGVLIGAGYWLSGLLVILLCLAVGWVLGRVLPGPFAVLGAAIVSVAVVEIPNPAPFSLIDPDPQWTSDLRVLMLKIALVSVLLCVAVFLPSSAGRDGRTRAARVVAVAVAVALVGASGMLGSPQVFRDPIDPLCFEGRVKVCAWPEQRVHSAMLQDIVGRVDGLPPEISFSRTEFWELGLRTRQVWEGNSVHIEEFADGTWYVDGLTAAGGAADATASFRIIDASPWSVASEMALYASWDGDTCDAGTEPSIKLRAWVEATLAGGGRPAYVMGGDPAMVALRTGGIAMADPSIPEHERLAWASDAVELARTSCA